MFELIHHFHVLFCFVFPMTHMILSIHVTFNIFHPGILVYAMDM